MPSNETIILYTIYKNYRRGQKDQINRIFDTDYLSNLDTLTNSKPNTVLDNRELSIFNQEFPALISMEQRLRTRLMNMKPYNKKNSFKCFEDIQSDICLELIEIFSDEYTYPNGEELLTGLEKNIIECIQNRYKSEGVANEKCLLSYDVVVNPKGQTMFDMMAIQKEHIIDSFAYESKSYADKTIESIYYYIETHELSSLPDLFRSTNVDARTLIELIIHDEENQVIKDDKVTTQKKIAEMLKEQGISACQQSVSRLITNIRQRLSNTVSLGTKKYQRLYDRSRWNLKYACGCRSLDLLKRCDPDLILRLDSDYSKEQRGQCIFGNEKITEEMAEDVFTHVEEYISNYSNEMRNKIVDDGYARKSYCNDMNWGSWVDKDGLTIKLYRSNKSKNPSETIQMLPDTYRVYDEIDQYTICDDHSRSTYSFSKNNRRILFR